MDYAQPGVSARRLAGLAVVVLVHTALIAALLYGPGRKIVEAVRAPLVTKIIEEPKPPVPEQPPPPPLPRLAAPPLPYIPPPEVRVQVPVTTPAITAVTPVKPAEPAAVPARSAPAAAPAAEPAKPRAPVRTAPVVDAKACEKPPYPAASLRAQETGIVLLSFLIDVDGKVLESRIERSSGYRRLDEAARNALGLCKFRPATVDGVPERSWARIEYEWKIE